MYLTKNKGQITEISLDYHLDALENGFSVCRWIVEQNFYDNVELIEMHTNDQRAARRMLEYLDEHIPENIKLQYFDEKSEIIEYKRK